VTVRLERADGTVLAEQSSTPTLAAAETTTRSLTGQPDALLGQAIAEAPPGTYQLVATSDGPGQQATITVQQPATPALGALSVAESVTTDTTELAPTVRLTNAGDLADTFAVGLQVLDASGEVQAETTMTQRVTPGDAADLTLPVEVSGLTPGEYTATATATVADTEDSTRQETVDTPFTVAQAAGELSVTVYTQTTSDAHTARAGTLTVTPVGADEPIATHDLADSATLTLTEGLETNREYVLATADIDDGVYPDGETTVTIDGETSVEFVTAYEFQGVESFRASVYLYAPNPAEDPNVISAPSAYYGWATHAADNDHYTRWFRVTETPAYDFGDPIHEHRVDLKQFHRDGSFNPVEAVRLDGTIYDHQYGEGATNKSKEWGTFETIAFDPKNPARENDGEQYPEEPLTSFTDADPDKQQFAGEVIIDGETLHQYNLTVENHPTSRAFLDPETGYIMRWETEKSYAGDTEQGFEIWTYSDHGQFDSLRVSEIDFAISSPPV
jgi:hypothetical protein